MGAITDVYHLPQCLCPPLGQGHHWTSARVPLLWGEPSPSAPPVLSARATTGDLPARRLHFGFSFVTWGHPGSLRRSPGAVEPTLCVLPLQHWTQPSPVPQDPSANFAQEEPLPGGSACLLPCLTPSDTHPLPTLSESLPFALTNGMPCFQLPTNRC